MDRAQQRMHSPGELQHVAKAFARALVDISQSKLDSEDFYTHLSKSLTEFSESTKENPHTFHVRNLARIFEVQAIVVKAPMKCDA